jgi:GT2 family glycosyltransferase
MAPAAESARRAATLGVSVVTYRPDAEVLRTTLDSLAAAAVRAASAGALGGVAVWLIDNGPDAASLAAVREAAGRLRERLPDCAVEVVSGQGNVGYGRANNLAIERSRNDFHLVLNPDVVLDGDALVRALDFMARHPDAALLAPSVRDEHGALLYLCKRYPSPWILALRGFAPRAIRACFDGALARYEMRDVINGDDEVPDVPIASGAFMFCRTAALRNAGGFDPAFFLYFEDFDLSLRLARHGRLYYAPGVRIVHFGGHSARKGFAHIRMFAASALRFFGKHGWLRGAGA